MLTRLSLRNAARNQLLGQTRAGNAVFPNRELPQRRRLDSPSIAVYTLSDRVVRRHADAPRRYLWEVEIAFELYAAKGRGAAGGLPTGADLDEDLDRFAHEVEKVLVNDPTLGVDVPALSFYDSDPVDFLIEFTREGERLRGDARLSWAFQYVSPLPDEDPGLVVPLTLVAVEWDLPGTGDPIDAADDIGIAQT